MFNLIAQHPWLLPLVLLAQDITVRAGGGHGLRNFNPSIEWILIGIVVIAAAIALVYIALRYFEVTIPPWVVRVFWVVVVAIVIIFAIRLVFSMW